METLPLGTLNRTSVKRIVVLDLLCLVLVGGIWDAHGQIEPTPVDVLDEVALQASELPYDDYSPTIASDGSRTWLAVWSSENPSTCDSGGAEALDADIRVARSTNRGATWQDLGFLNSNACEDSGDDHTSQIQTDGQGVWLAVWESTENLRGTAGFDQDIFFARSTDNGLSWTNPALLNGNGTSDILDDYDPQMATNGAGNWVAVWWSFVNGDTDIVVARSADNGATWTPPAQLNSIDLREDSNPSIATDGMGHWVVTWDSNGDLGGLIEYDFNILVSRSTDNGATWTSPVVLNTDAPSVDLWDGSSSLATDRRGNWVAVWQRWLRLPPWPTDIMVARSTDHGATWTPPMEVSMQNSDPQTNPIGSYGAQIATDRDGNWVAVWQSIEPHGGAAGTDSDISVSYSTDNGATWTPPALLNTNATSDLSDDKIPRIAVDGRGNWLVVWESNEDLFWDSPDWDINSHAGEDYDIFFTRFIHPRVKVTIPNAGEMVVQGSRQKIKWKTIGNAGDSVHIDLFHKGQKVRRIKKSTANDGRAVWRVYPTEYPEGEGYKIRVTPLSARAGKDASDSTFSIVP